MATYGLFAIGTIQVALKSREVSVPELSGKTVDEAIATLANAELTARIEPVRRIHPTIGTGLVAEQDPSAGLTTRQRRSVKVWLSSGPTASAIPVMIGESVDGARLRLSDNSFDLNSVSEIRSRRYPTDAVVAQETAPTGTDQGVSLLLNRGERGRTYVMPDLIGVTGSMAAEILRNQGFRVTVVGDHPYPGIPSGIVLRQYPDAGFQIAHGEPISLEVSR